MVDYKGLSPLQELELFRLRALELLRPRAPEPKAKQEARLQAEASWRADQQAKYGTPMVNVCDQPWNAAGQLGDATLKQEPGPNESPAHPAEVVSLLHRWTEDVVGGRPVKAMEDIILQSFFVYIDGVRSFSISRKEVEAMGAPSDILRCRVQAAARRRLGDATLKQEPGPYIEGDLYIRDNEKIDLMHKLRDTVAQLDAAQATIATRDATIRNIRLSGRHPTAAEAVRFMADTTNSRAQHERAKAWLEEFAKEAE